MGGTDLLFDGGSDIIRKSVLESFDLGDLTLGVVIATIVLAFAIGLFILLIYKITFSGVVYAKSFGTSLIMLTMITSMIILPIATNLYLALGMVGALSIVRFRTAVKDPLDTIYMFWAIAAGITLGSGQFAVAGLGSLLVGGLLLIWNLFKSKKRFPYLLVVRFDDASKKEVQSVLRRMPQGKLKSKIVSQGMVELTIEMNIHEDEMGMVDAFANIPGVHDASIISYKGDVVS